MSEERWKIILVDRMQFFRRPRTKKRRILKKWRKRPENWRPLMLPIATTYLIGAHAARAGYATPAAAKQNPYLNEQDPGRPRILEMHTELWRKVQRDGPVFAAKCDVFRRVIRTVGRVIYEDEIPEPSNT